MQQKGYSGAFLRPLNKAKSPACWAGLHRLPEGNRGLEQVRECRVDGLAYHFVRGDGVDGCGRDGLVS